MIQDRAGFLENGVGHHNRRVTTQVLSADQMRFPAHACRALRVPEGSVGRCSSDAGCSMGPRP